MPTTYAADRAARWISYCAACDAIGTDYFDRLRRPSADVAALHAEIDAAHDRLDAEFSDLFAKIAG